MPQGPGGPSGIGPGGIGPGGIGPGGIGPGGPTGPGAPGAPEADKGPGKPPPVPENPVIGFNVGDIAPEISGEDIDGKKFKLSDYKGKVVVLDFWGNW
jgi:hypothetical protein